MVFDTRSGYSIIGPDLDVPRRAPPLIVAHLPAKGADIGFCRSGLLGARLPRLFDLRREGEIGGDRLSRIGQDFLQDDFHFEGRGAVVVVFG